MLRRFVNKLQTQINSANVRKTQFYPTSLVGTVLLGQYCLTTVDFSYFLGIHDVQFLLNSDKPCFQIHHVTGSLIPQVFLRPRCILFPDVSSPQMSPLSRYILFPDVSSFQISPLFRYPLSFDVSSSQMSPLPRYPFDPDMSSSQISPLPKCLLFPVVPSSQISLWPRYLLVPDDLCAKMSSLPNALPAQIPPRPTCPSVNVSQLNISLLRTTPRQLIPTKPHPSH